MRLWGAIASAGLLVTALLLAFLGGGGGGDGAVPTRAPGLVSVSELVEAEEELGHLIYWAGRQPGRRLELAVEPEGSVFLRYLPPGAAVGDQPGAFLTVGSYPVVDAQAAILRSADSAGVDVERVANSGIVLANPDSQGSVYLAYPDSDLQIEVYDPRPGEAMELIESGAIEPVS